MATPPIKLPLKWDEIHPFSHTNDLITWVMESAARDQEAIKRAFDNAWVILVDREGRASQTFIHYEPLSTYCRRGCEDPWEFYKFCANSNDVKDWFDSEDHDILVKGILQNTGRKSAYYPKNIRPANKLEVSRTTRIKVFERDNYRCCACGRSANDGVILEIDHIIPRKEGGTNNIDNLQVLCFDCNRGKREKILPNMLSNNDLEVR